MHGESAKEGEKMGKNSKLKNIGKGFLWSSRSFSLSVDSMLLMYLTYFCSDTLGLNLGVIGTMLLVAKVVDAVTNFIFAYMVDNFHFKSGKGRPYEILIIPAWICTFIMFGIPVTWKAAIQYAVVFLMYTIIVSVFHTALYCTEPIYLNHAVKEEDRIPIQTVNGIVTTLSFTIAAIVVPILMGVFAGQENMWLKIAVICGIPCMVLGMIRYFCFKEFDIAISEKQEKIGILDAAKGMFTNKYVLLWTLVTFTVNVVGGFSSSTTYYFQYIIGDVTLMAVLNSLGIVAILIMPVCGMLAAKFRKSNLVGAFFMIAASGNVIKYFAGTNLPGLTVGSLLAGVMSYPVAIFGSLILIDCMDYGEWKNGKRVEGAIFAATGLGSTIGSGVGSALFGIIMNICGYDGMAQVQSSSAIFGINLTFSILPCIIYIIVGIVIFTQYDLEKKLPKVREELQQRRAAKA